MSWLNMILRFMRLGPLALGLIAVAIMVVGYFLQVKQNETHALNAQILAAGAPAPINLVDAVGLTALDTDEVVIQAQLAWDYSYDFWFEERLGTDYVVMFPLVAAKDNGVDEILGVAILQAEDDSFTTLSPEMVKEWLVTEGNIGPVMNLNGELGGMGKWDGLIEEAFWDMDLTMPDNPVVIWPYVEGREAALAAPQPGEMTIFGLLSKIAGVIGLLALGKLVLRPEGGTQSEAATAQAQPVQSAAPVRAGMQSMYEPLAETMGFDEAADVMAYEPASAVQMPETEDAIVVPKRGGIGVRKIWVGIVGAAFLLLLGSVVFGLVQDSTATNAPVAVTSVQEIAAETVADYVVPDADPNRHWTEIDVTPIVEWVVAKGVLALAGDMDAMITIAMIAGGVLFAPMMLWFFFKTRRSLGPKTTARFDAMGIN